MSIIDDFALRHTQLSAVHADLHKQASAEQAITAKVELNMTPREMQRQQESLPTYQITAMISCHGEAESDGDPLFSLQLTMHAAYQQIGGEAMDFERFKRSHAPFTRQLYPLLHQHMRQLMLQLGLETVKLPYDLAEGKPAPQQQAVVLH
ncbi:MAG: hypothetical protein KKC01_13195 [Gammaproteobacteria bacterium]|nr:hypothetical protein [Gammaproteobacteria bacterium]